MNRNQVANIQAFVQRAPQGLRHDLVSKDKAVRARAEEAMSAMIAEALTKSQDD